MPGSTLHRNKACCALWAALYSMACATHCGLFFALCLSCASWTVLCILAQLFAPVAIGAGTGMADCPAKPGPMHTAHSSKGLV
eukprot:1157686-Pelagomonas_calceolata.AAC.3